MFAAQYYGVRDVRVEKVKTPVCGSGQVLIKVAYGGICGSDLHNYRKGMFMTYTPEIIGHEFSGVVLDIGKNVEGICPGDHVVGDPRVGCGTCFWCEKGQINLCPDLGFIGEVSPGCFAEYLVFDSQKLFIVPKAVNLQEAALIEPLGVALHIVSQAQLQPSDTLGIIGAGPIGLLTLMAAKALYQCRVHIVDIAPASLMLAEKLGADRTLTKVPEGHYVDAAVEAVGLGLTLKACLSWLRPQGKLIMAGLYEEKIDLDPNPIVAKELAVSGINAYQTADLQLAVDLIAKKKVEVKKIISQVYPLAEINKAFDLLTSPRGEAGKVLIVP